MNSHQEIEQLTRRHGSPFYYFDQAAFVRNFRDLRAAFERRYPEVVIGYSYKTNYIPHLCRLVDSLGGYAEVVSRLELELALKIGCPPARVIFNGPVKTDADLAFALNAGVLVNLDTWREWECVSGLAKERPEQPFRIGLRINIPLIDPQGNSHLQGELPAGRFGFPPEALPVVVERLRALPNLQVCSLHGHTSSTSRSLWIYRKIAATLAEIGERHFPEAIDLLNVGGGFYGRRVPAMGLTETPSYDDYAAAIGEELLKRPWIETRRPRLVVEPGMALVADTLSFVTRVFEVKTIGDRQLAVVDGSIFNVKPTQHPRNHPFSVIKPQADGAPRGRYSVVGATCMEKDCLLREVESVALERGDFIRIENVGAYTVVLTPPFILPAPAILVCGSKGYAAIRQRQDFHQVFAGFLFDSTQEAP